MARTANRHIVTDVVDIRAEPQHVDALGAQKRHTGFVGFRADPRPGEVLTQVCAHLRQDVDHSAGSGGVWSLVGGGGVCSADGAGTCSAGRSGAGLGAGGSCAPVGSIVRFTPVSASKIAILEVSKASSMVRSEEHTSELQSLRHLV